MAVTIRQSLEFQIKGAPRRLTLEMQVSSGADGIAIEVDKSIRSGRRLSQALFDATHAAIAWSGRSVEDGLHIHVTALEVDPARPLPAYETAVLAVLRDAASAMIVTALAALPGGR